MGSIQANTDNRCGISSPEYRSLVISSSGNFMMGCVGITAALISNSQAIILDGLFNLAYLATGLFTLKVTTLLQLPDDERFPYGYAFFEPLVNGIKGVLVLGVSLVAMWGAIDSLFKGGRIITPGVAVAYGLFATTFCALIAFITHRGANRSISPLVRADADNWYVNAAISFCVVLAFAMIYVIQSLPVKFLIPFIDPIIVLTIVLITIGVPIRMAWKALMQLLNRAPSTKYTSRVSEIIKDATSELPVRNIYVRVIQPGRTRMVLAHVILPEDDHSFKLAKLDMIRNKTLDRLKDEHLATMMDMIFTTDENIGKPQPTVPSAQNMK